VSNISLYTRLPDQQIENWTKEDYMGNLRFIASKWNFQSANYVAIQNNNGSTSIPSIESAYGFVYRYLQNVTYIYGSQVPSDFGFFVQDVNGNDTRVPMYRGRDVSMYYKYIIGKVSEMIRPLPKMVNVIGYSENVQSTKKTRLNMVKYRYEMQEQIKLIEEMTGWGFEPMAGIDYENDFEVSKRLENFQEAMEETYENLAIDGLYKNKYFEAIKQVAKDIFISGIAGVKVEHDNGRIYWKNVRLHQLIFDNTKEKDQHEDDDFAGEVYELTINDILTRWEWTEEETEDIKAMASNPASWSQFNSLIGVNGMYWWNQNNGVPKVTCVEGQWRSQKKVDGVWVETLRQGILIGNKYLRETGETDGQVWDINDKRKKRLKYRIVSPDTRLGAIEGIVGMIKRFQDLKDAFITKVVALASSAIGKSYFVNAHKLPEGFKTPDIISQLKQANIVVLEGANEDETPEDANKRLIEPVDMTIDPGIGSLLDIARYFDEAMANILNIPPQVRGMQENYQSKDVYSSNLAQSEYGMKWYYDSIMSFVEHLLSYHANLAKLVLPETAKGRENLSLIIGDVNTALISMEEIKRIQFEDFLLAIIPNDIISAADKKEYLQIAMQLAAAGQFSMRDYVKLKRTDNVKQMEHYFEKIEIAREQRAERERQATIAAAEQNTKINAQAQQNIAATQTEGKLIDREMQNEQKTMDMVMQNQKKE